MSKQSSKTPPATEKKKVGRPSRSIVSALQGDLVTIHIQFPSADVEAIDRYATTRRQTRSAVVRDMVIDHLMSRGFLQASQDAIQPEPPVPVYSDELIREQEAAFKRYIETLTPEQQAKFFKA